MYEKKNEPLLSRQDFIKRIAWHVFAGVLMIGGTMALGMFGHMVFEEIDLHDAFLNTALIMGGIGTTVMPASIGGKLFFSFFGMFVGLLFAAVVGVVMAPVIHRIVHHMHLDDE